MLFIWQLKWVSFLLGHDDWAQVPGEGDLAFVGRDRLVEGELAHNVWVQDELMFEERHRLKLP